VVAPSRAEEAAIGAAVASLVAVLAAPPHPNPHPFSDDQRHDPLEVRKATLASMLVKAGPDIRFNEHIVGDGPTVFRHACAMGLEGIVSKRKDSPYRSGRTSDWVRVR
jgi:hypothetical protein